MDEINKWGAQEVVDARDQGWGIFDSDVHGLRIERDDELGVFQSDDEAIEFVKSQFMLGYPLAIKAVKYLVEQNPSCSKLDGIFGLMEKREILDSLDRTKKNSEALGL